MSFIEIRNVMKRYGSKLSVDHLNLSVEQGEIFGLLGLMAREKSTTIKMMSGLLKIDQGLITVEGIDVGRSPMEAKRRIGLVPQEIAVYEDLSARENVTFFRQALWSERFASEGTGGGSARFCRPAGKAEG